MRILVLRLSALGDVIHTIPAVLALRGAAEVTWTVETPYAEMVEIVAGVRAVPVRLKRWSRSPVASRRVMRNALRAMRGAEVSVDFQGLVKSAGLGWLARVPVRYGFDRDAIREKAALVFTNHQVAVDTTEHVVDQNLELASTIVADLRSGTENGPRPTDNWLSFPADPRNRLDRFRDRIVLLAGAGRPEKVWPAERFRELIGRFGERCLVVWGPGEEDAVKAIGGPMAPATDLRELAFILRHARVVVGGDTGPLHLAAALGTAVVGLYGPTDPRRNGPYGQLASCIDMFGSTGTMESIGAAEVMAKLEEVLG